MKFPMAPSSAIAMVTDDFNPAVTGVGVHVQKIAGELARRGRRIVVITSRRKGQPDFEEVEGVRIHRVPCVVIQGFSQALALPRTMEKIFRDEGVGLVHFHYLSLLMLSGLRAARRSKTPTAYTAHMTVDLLFQPFFMRPFQSLITHLYFGLLERLDQVLCPSSAQAQGVSQFTIHPRVHRVPNPIEFAEGAPPVANTGGTFSVLYVGRLGPEKNVGYLLRAFQSFARTHPHAEVNIAGSGVMEEEWRRLAKTLGVAEKVHFLGSVPHDNLPSLYARCDVFFLPSVKEVLALVALEAMRCARPVIVTDRIACGPELVEDGQTGWIVNADRPEEAAEQLRRLASDPDLGREMGKRGLARSQAYSFPTVMDRLEMIYDAATAPTLDKTVPLESEVRADRRGVCVLCGAGKLSDSIESGILTADTRIDRDAIFRMWRCDLCRSLHTLSGVASEDLEKQSPFLRRRLNPFNRRMFEGFHRLLQRHGVGRDQSILFYGLSAELFKRVFEENGQAPMDIVTNTLSPESLVSPPSKRYDVVVVMEYLECAEDPRHVLTFAARQLKPGGLLVIHTPDAERIHLTPKASQRLYQPHRIHVAGAGVLIRLVEGRGFRARTLLHRNYMDTLWPFVNYRAFHELPHWGDGTVDAAIDFRIGQLRRAWWRLPRLIFLGLLGGLWGDRSNVIAVFEKSLGTDNEL